MLKQVSLAFTFIISLVFSIASIFVDFSECSPSESDSFCSGFYAGQIFAVLSMISICMVSGYFLFLKKKPNIKQEISTNISMVQNGSKTSQNNFESIESKLEKLKSMYNKGLITKEEFENKKHDLIEEI